MITASFTAAWYTPREARQASELTSKYRNRIRSRKSLATPGSAATIKGREYTIRRFSRLPSKENRNRMISGRKTARHSTQLTRMAKTGYVKSGTGETRPESTLCGCAAAKAGYQKKSARLERVSVRIFAVLMTANFTALCSCRSLANKMAVTLSQNRIPPM